MLHKTEVAFRSQFKEALWDVKYICETERRHCDGQQLMCDYVAQALQQRFEYVTFDGTMLPNREIWPPEDLECWLEALRSWCVTDE